MCLCEKRVLTSNTKLNLTHKHIVYEIKENIRTNTQNPVCFSGKS